MDQYSPYRTSWKTLDKHSIQGNLMEHSWINVLPPNITDRGATMCYRTPWEPYVINGILQKGTTQCIEAHGTLGNLLELSMEHDGISAEQMEQMELPRRV